MGEAGAGSFVGRADDLARLRLVLDRLRSGASAALVLSGDMGIGKTRILEYALHEALDLHTIAISGYESEVGLGFAGLHRLLRPLIPEMRDLLEPQRQALAVAFGLETGPPPYRFLVGLATLALLEKAARHQPVLCVVDDFQWVDRDTRDVLALLARRLDEEAVGLLLGLRDGEGDGDGDGVSLGLEGIPVHRLAPLPEADSRALLRQMSPDPVAPDVAARLVAESQGNPLALLAYADVAAERQEGSTPSLSPALPVGERVFQVFSERIARLPEATQRMLLVLAAAYAESGSAVAAACAALGLPADAPEPAIAASIISPGPRRGFRHPLLRSVVYERASEAERRTVHAALADVTGAQGHPDEAVWHRVHATSGTDDQLAAQLEAMAVRARMQGGYATEATFLTLAMQRSDPGSDEQARRLLAAAHAHVLSGSGAEAERLLESHEVRASWRPRVMGVRVAAQAQAHDHRTGLEAGLLMETVRRLPPQDVEVARQLLFQAFHIVLETRGYSRGTTMQDVASELLRWPLAEGSRPTPMDLVHEGLATRLVSGYQAGALMLAQALRDLVRSPGAAAGGQSALMTRMAMEDLWDDEFASTTWVDLTSLNEARGALPSTYIGLGTRALTEARHGHFAAAQDLFDRSASLLADIGRDRTFLWAGLVELRAWQGHEDDVRSMADTLMTEMGQKRRYGSADSFARYALSLLDLSLGHYSSAFAHASQVARDDPPGHGSRILPDLVEAAVRSKSHAAAAVALAELELRAGAAGTPWAMGLLARSRALVLGTSPRAEEHYIEALTVLGATPLGTEVARSRLLYGEWLRRCRRRSDAQAQLDASFTAFSEMGATAFAERAAAELGILGHQPGPASPVRLPALTSQEARVAGLVARGMTNAEVSEQLFISHSTVDYHLSKVFRKLQITSRRKIREVIETVDLSLP